MGPWSLTSRPYFKTCIVKQFFQCMYTTKVEGGDVKVYEIAKDCIKLCIPKSVLQGNSAECLTECFETKINKN